MSLSFVSRCGARYAPLLVLSVPLLAGCVPTGAALDETLTGSIQPARAVYRCEEGRALTVEATQSTVAVTDGEERIVLAAAPPGQTSRFSEGPDVLVAEGGEALWMRAGETPLNCVR